MMLPVIASSVASKHDAAMSAIRSALDDSPEEMNDYEREIVANIRDTGWQGTHVFPGEESPGFGYSTGFWVTVGIPEILICSLPGNVAQSILRYILEKADTGFVPPVGVAVADIMVGYDCYFFPIRKEGYEEYPLSSNWFYHGFDYPCLQLVWADEAGLFPWQPGFNEAFRNDQPDLSPEGWLAHLAN